MNNLIFLEAAIQSEGAEIIIESNEKLINFATAEVDALVEEQALHTAWHVGAFVENDFSTTYENVTDPVADIVTEATSIFAEIIASDTSDMDKKVMIESYAHIISMGDVDSVLEIDRGEQAIGAIGGGIAGSAIGAGVAATHSLFSKERKIWKGLVAQEKELLSKGGNSNQLKKVHDAKVKAKERYIEARKKSMAKGSTIGAASGTVLGAVGMTAIQNKN